MVGWAGLTAKAFLTLLLWLFMSMAWHRRIFNRER
jgi:hypothetical protein